MTLGHLLRLMHWKKGAGKKKKDEKEGEGPMLQTKGKGRKLTGGEKKIGGRAEKGLETTWRRKKKGWRKKIKSTEKVLKKTRCQEGSRSVGRGRGVRTNRMSTSLGRKKKKKNKRIGYGP